MEVLYGGAAGGGKAQPLYSLVATPYGWKRMGDIEVGDEVCTPDGAYSKVIQIHPQGIVPIYELTFQDGSKCETSADHLWYSKPVRDGEDRWKVRTTKEIFDSKRDFVIPLGVCNRDEKELPLDPYILGCLLGDGGMTTNSITFTSADTHFEKYLPLVKRKSRYCYGVKGVVSILRELNLLGCNSYSKFIPEEYMTSSWGQRIELIQGLMDTDGYVSADGKVNYTSVSDKLRNQMAELIRSVGGTAQEFKGHSLYIRHPDSDILFKLDRKKKRTHKKKINNRIVSIECVGVEECQCITIDSREQLYITDNYIVTHNSFAMIADPVRGFNTPGQRALLLRRTTEELREIISVTQELYPRAIPGCRYDKRDKTWYFPSGASLWMSYLDAEDDVLRYQGQAFQWIGFDELTQWPTSYPWDYLRSRLRGDKGSGLYMRATTNPGGPGTQWVKKMFVDPAPWGKAFWATDIETGRVLTWPPGHSKEGEPLFKRRFIPAKLWDNPYLAVDGLYEANLLSMSEVERKKLLEGNWDVQEGAAFPEWNREIHVVEPYEIPEHWIKFRGCDYGYSDGSAVVWYAIRPDTGQLVQYRELYGKKILADDLGDMILEAEKEDKNIYYGVLGSDSWNQRGDRGPSIGEVLSKKCRFRKADRSRGSRIHGKQEFHRRLQIDEYTGEPRMVIFNNCVETITQIPILPLDKNNPEDVDTKAEDHIYDAKRYAIMTRPLNSLYASQRPRKEYRPADRRTGY